MIPRNARTVPSVKKGPMNASFPTPPRPAPPAAAADDADSAARFAQLGRLDNLIHAAEGRATLGLSPTALGLAWLDWATHLANAPFRRLGLARAAAHQARRFWGSGGDRGDGDRAPAGRSPLRRSRLAAPALSPDPSGLPAGRGMVARSRGGPDGTARANDRIVAFAARQWLDLFSPSNVPWLNPEVIAATAASGGRNLAAGTANLLTDLQAL